MTTVRDFKHRPTLPPRPPAPSPRPERRPFRDNPRLILAGIVLLLVSLVAMITLADRSTQLNPDFLSEVVLYALTLADATMLVALAFVLARNVVKLFVERRRGLPFSRFRLKLVAGLLKACEKRPVSIASIEKIADRVESALQDKPEKEISTEEIGAFVMNELRRLDKVAYVRFASVYRHFRDIGEFMSELKDLLNTKE